MAHATYKQSNSIFSKNERFYKTISFHTSGAFSRFVYTASRALAFTEIKEFGSQSVKSYKCIYTFASFR